MRTAGLALVLLVAFIVLAPTLRAYVSQQEQLREVNASLAQAQEEAAALEEELARWEDPEYVKSQASARFNLVAPGETGYKVVDPETVDGEDPIGDLTAQEAARSPYAVTATLPWYSTVWGSVEVAGAAQQTAAEAEAAQDVPADGAAPPASDTP
ncbi:FtsB family cell division protein [Litorihabitans aurantiacus]|uniref:Septum formation initiator n=1 Tax=Litorihabitans aurantiacus TaxID=1930061 RepID=A0AA37UU21_9MICO|nr:septum formation initiator family protein [Litorihabitans aurantiacus]GMA30507.1 septum formation initiator [Litorihabitans aurantiacus]